MLVRKITYNFNHSCVFSDSSDNYFTTSFEDLKCTYNLSKRDKYILDENVNLETCVLTTKNNCIILQIDDIKCIICSDHVLFVTNKQIHNFDAMLKSIKKSISEKKNNESNTYNEFIVLEEIFIHVSNKYDDEVDKIIKIMTEIHNAFNINNSSTVWNKIMITDNKVIDIKCKVKDIKDKFIEILDWDKNDLADFYIREDKNINSIETAVNQIELLIETYKEHFEDYDDKLSKMNKQLDLLVKKTNLLYAEKRNQIAIYNTQLSIVTLALTSANTISSIFGMNLKNYLEHNAIGFFIVVAFTFVTSIVCYLMFNKYSIKL